MTKEFTKKASDVFAALRACVRNVETFVTNYDYSVVDLKVNYITYQAASVIVSITLEYTDGKL